MRFFRAGGNITAAPDASLIKADEHFLQTAGIKMVGGRDFRAGDSGRVIINEVMARKLHLDPAHAEGTTLYSQYGNGQQVSFELAGVFKNYNYNSLHDTIDGQAILYNAADGQELFASVSSKDYGVLMAVLISALGLFGLAAFSTEQRIKEIGIRKVLGASVLQLTALLSKDFLKLVGIAILIATPIAWWAMDKWLAAFAYRVPIAWWMFALAGLAAVLIALVTVSSQAIRGALLNPAKSLKSE